MCIHRDWSLGLHVGIQGWFSTGSRLRWVKCVAKATTYANYDFTVLSLAVHHKKEPLIKSELPSEFFHWSLTIYAKSTCMLQYSSRHYLHLIPDSLKDGLSNTQCHWVGFTMPYMARCASKNPSTTFPEKVTCVFWKTTIRPNYDMRFWWFESLDHRLPSLRRSRLIWQTRSKVIWWQLNLDRFLDLDKGLKRRCVHI